MEKQNLSKFEKVKIFLNEFYFGYGILFSILRIVGGPLILTVGLNTYFYGTTKTGIGNSEFIILFGVYYCLNPLIIILTKKSWFNNFDLHYEIQPDKMIISSDKSKTELDYSELKTVKKRKTYFVLKTISKQGIYLPLKLLNLKEIDILNNLKTQ